MHNHLFIVTYGRTGSTLLLGIPNAHPEIHITGENGQSEILGRLFVAPDHGQMT